MDLWFFQYIYYKFIIFICFGTELLWMLLYVHMDIVLWWEKCLIALM